MSEFALWGYRAALRRLRDADTAELVVDVGFDVRYEAAVRLARIDAPELGTVAGQEATEYVTRWLAEYEDEPWPLRVRTVRRERADDFVRSFDRWIAEVYLVEPDGVLANISDALVAAGHARYRDGEGPLPEGE